MERIFFPDIFISALMVNYKLYFTPKILILPYHVVALHMKVVGYIRLAEDALAVCSNAMTVAVARCVDAHATEVYVAYGHACGGKRRTRCFHA